MQALTKTQTAAFSASTDLQAIGTKFMLVSTNFGYCIYTMFDKASKDVNITDQLHEATVFERSFDDGKKMAAVMSKVYGYPFAALPV